MRTAFIFLLLAAENFYAITVVAGLEFKVKSSYRRGRGGGLPRTLRKASEASYRLSSALTLGVDRLIISWRELHFFHGPLRTDR
jgi:hypothetical protein